MQDLTPVGLSKDGSRLVLVSAAGEEYAVPVDHRFRAALRGDARLGQLEMKMQSALRPRDIQARIRAGESPETVAAAAQTTVDAIMAFANPVLAERAHIAATALKSSVRRRSAESSSGARTLRDAAAAHLHDVGVAEDEVEWDAWRREDGRWTLVADYAADGKPCHAEFSYDVPGRYVVATNDEGRLLTGEARPATPQARGQRRLSAVRDDDELPLGDDALELVRESAEDPAADHADADWIAEPAAELAQHDDGRRPAVDDRDDVEDTEVLPVDGAAPVDEPVHATRHAAPRDPGPDEDPQAAPEAGNAVGDATPAAGRDAGAGPEQGGSASRPARRKARSSVPSWDEIMFGGGGTE
jgi:Protein of unknown function (DUF3071)